MQKYQLKKPKAIEAVCFYDTGECKQELSEWIGCGVIVSYDNPDRPVLTVPNQRFFNGANVGDYIIKGSLGYLYVCTPEEFERTYELIE